MGYISSGSEIISEVGSWNPFLDQVESRGRSKPKEKNATIRMCFIVDTCRTREYRKRLDISTAAV